MNDTDFDLDNDDATLAEHLKLFHGVVDFDLFNHSYSFMGWWCSGTSSGFPCRRSGVRFPYPPILEKCAKGICLCNLLRLTQPNDRETVIEG